MEVAHGRWRGAAVLLLTIGISAVAGAAFLGIVYGFAPLLSALLHANAALVAMAIGVGAVLQVVRAQRAAVLLSGQRQVRLSDTYNAMVVGHGIGDLVPIAPCGVALRCFLTERLSALSVAFSAGVFMLEGVLDGLGPTLLTGFLLLALHLPTWLRVLLVASLGQALLFFTVPVIAHVLRRSQKLSMLPGWIARLIAASGDVTDGLVGGLSRGIRHCLSVAGISLLITALGGIQLVLFLSAFGLTTSVPNLVLILVLTLAAGSLPIKIPGSGTVATTAVLQVAGIHGAGVAGFVLMSRVVLSSETTVLACASLAWWSATGKLHDLRLGAALHSLSQARWQTTLSQARSIGYRLGGVFAPVGVLATRRMWPRSLMTAIGLFGVVALSGPVSNSLRGHEAVLASAVHPASALSARTVHADGTQDALNAQFRGMPDFLRDALRASGLAPPGDYGDRDRLRT
jgi:hypothetical protein